jgi:hypothetical protein
VLALSDLPAATLEATRRLTQMHEGLLGFWLLKIQFSGLDELQTYLSLIASLF